MLATPGEFDVAICPTCASGTTFPLLEPESSPRSIPDAYGPYAETDGGLVQAISKAIRARQGRLALSRFPLDAIAARPPGRGLDVGCGRGDLAAEFVDRGWTMVGVEPSPNACDAARARGVDARVGTLATVELEPGAYDMIVFQHSLEHTLDPRATSRRCSPRSLPAGCSRSPSRTSATGRRVASATAGSTSTCRATARTSPATGCASLATHAGLEVQEIGTSTSTVGLPATIQYRLAGRCLFPGGLKLRVAAGLCVLTLPLARLLDRGDGDQLHLLARRTPF